MNILAIDPGATTGLAWGNDYRLVGADKIYPDSKQRPPPGPWDLLVVEWPVLTQRGPGNVITRGNDLITLGIRLGRLIESVKYSTLRMYTPTQWKGQVPKPVHNRRVLAALTTVERVCVLDDHNVIDAVGLYLYGRDHRLC
jgi:hypothetical protein